MRAQFKLEDRFDNLIAERLIYLSLTRYLCKTIEEVLDTGSLDDDSKKKLRQVLVMNIVPLKEPEVPATDRDINLDKCI